MRADQLAARLKEMKVSTETIGSNLQGITLNSVLDGAPEGLSVIVTRTESGARAVVTGPGAEKNVDKLVSGMAEAATGIVQRRAMDFHA